MTPAVHQAGEPQGLTQRCARCGVALMAYHPHEYIDPERRFWFRGNVLVDGVATRPTTDPPTCEPTEEPSDR